MIENIESSTTIPTCVERVKFDLSRYHKKIKGRLVVSGTTGLANKIWCRSSQPETTETRPAASRQATSSRKVHD